ncbi:MAG TPA: TIGR02281 family clan AA aspartic protease [Aestuariivirgaceae bacterium]|jgi:aspartyl protease family protein|nr:TIGR02281 family clan AA aspartic protease [Aestuariivirgaceae bacterium]
MARRAWNSAVVAVFFGFAGAWAPCAFASSAEIAADAMGHFVTTAEIEHTAIKVLVDTGASVVALSYEDAEEAGLSPRTLKFDVPVSTANGQVEAARVVLDRVEIGNVLVRDVEGIVLPKGAYGGTLLGMSFLNKLSRFKVEDRTLYLDE